MMHYEATAAICALGAKGDKSLAKEGLRHCDMAIQICDRYYQRVLNDLWRSRLSSRHTIWLLSFPLPASFPFVRSTGDTQTANARQFAEGRGMRVG